MIAIQIAQSFGRARPSNSTVRQIRVTKQDSANSQTGPWTRWIDRLHPFSCLALARYARASLPRPPTPAADPLATEQDAGRPVQDIGRKARAFLVREALLTLLAFGVSRGPSSETSRSTEKFGCLVRRIPAGRDLGLLLKAATAQAEKRRPVSPFVAATELTLASNIRRLRWRFADGDVQKKY